MNNKGLGQNVESLVMVDEFSENDRFELDALLRLLEYAVQRARECGEVRLADELQVVQQRALCDLHEDARPQ